MRLKLAQIILILAFGITAFASEINTAGKIFLLEPGARSLGVGGCGTLLGEANSGMYNPAAMALTPDVSFSAYLNPHPHSGPLKDYVNIMMGARSEFGFIGFTYYVRPGIDGTDYPDEEGTAFIIGGRPSHRINLAWGVGFKVLGTTKTGFIPINQSWSKSYKMAFDFGLVFYDAFPMLTYGETRRDFIDPLREPMLRTYKGLSFGLAFQNLGGRIEYDNTLDYDMLPQTFRSDFQWVIVKTRKFEARTVGQLQKLLVSRKKSDDPQYPYGGYNKATDAFFQAWGGGAGEGGWTSRLGFEVSYRNMLSVRSGWSKDHKTGRAFNYWGLGAGLDWIKLNIVREHEPGTDIDFADELRYELSASISYQELRNWIRE